MSNDGASISNQDPRVTRGAQWIGNILQGLIVLALAFVANNLWSVNVALVDIVANNRSRDADVAENRVWLQSHDQRLEGLSGRVYVLEGKSLRGPPK